MAIFDKVFGSYSDREIKKIYPIVDKVLALEDEVAEYSDTELQAKTIEFKERLANGESLDDLLPEAFAVVREASARVLEMKHFPVQVVGGVVLHQGRIAEMKTGEGKTLVATLPAYLNALEGKGVHIVTVNDYLARRDSEWMGKIYNFLGLSVGLVVHGLSDIERKVAYAADITYATNNEMGFDYLRDNMAIFKEQTVQRGHNFAIVDEVDSILIDEARTPLIISGQGDKSTELYAVANAFVRSLKKKVVKESDTKDADEGANEDVDYIVDEKAKTSILTAQGIKKAEKAFNLENLSDPENMTISHHINQALKAHGTMHRDDNYVVKDGQVMIVDEFTGRIMHGRRYSDGLHQAIEAKEGVKVERESKTLATITFQNYFRMYKKLSGMTGTAQTEESEFQGIYKLDVIVIPTNKPLVRADLPDVVYKNHTGKLNAIVEDILQVHEKGQPILVGTVTVEKSEELSKLLKKRGIKHEVLNAKFHDKEAEIIAQAGKFGAVTIATNMAGRGTDIILGGNAEFMSKREMKKQGYENAEINAATSHAETDDPEILEARKKYNELYDKHKKEIAPETEKVLEAGGLYIIGTERHESRRIDNQLRGRAGRQGDVGASRFYLGIDDDLMRIFGSERMTNVVETMGLDENTPVQAGLLTKTIESAQKRVEGRNFDMRKHVIQYDDVMNGQREIIYEQRQKVLDGEDISGLIINYAKSVGQSIVDQTISSAPKGEGSDAWNWEFFHAQMLNIFGIEMVFTKEEQNNMGEYELAGNVEEALDQGYEKKRELFGDQLGNLERVILLRVVDQKWMDHLDEMEQLKQGITYRSYAQKDPVVEYKFEGMAMFDEMIESIKEETVRYIFHANPAANYERKQVAQSTKEGFEVSESAHDQATKQQTKGASAPVRVEKIGRNELCPCGSGKKYKHCCGKES